jgi:hypothetical protein
MSMFDEPRPYSVYKYVTDESGEPTVYAGQIVAFVKATNPWEAVEKAGFDDMNAYGASMVDEEQMDNYKKAIAEERKLLSKISKELNGFIEEREAELRKLREERECPNGCGKMDEHFRCKACGFGYELENSLVPTLEQEIADKKKNGEDTKELEEFLNRIKENLK